MANNTDPRNGSGIRQSAYGAGPLASAGWAFNQENRLDLTYGADSVDPSKMRFGVNVCIAATCFQEIEHVLDRRCVARSGCITTAKAG